MNDLGLDLKESMDLLMPASREALTLEEQFMLVVEFLEKNHRRSEFYRSTEGITLRSSLGLATRRGYDGATTSIHVTSRTANITTWLESGHNGDAFSEETESVDFEKALSAAIPFLRKEAHIVLKSAAESRREKEAAEAAERDLDQALLSR